MQTPLLEAKNVEVSYGRIRAVRGVSLTVAEGEFVALIGANGSGKTTLLRSLVGLEKVKRGTVKLASEEITSLRTERRIKRGVAFVPEGRGVLPYMTVRENLHLGSLVNKDRSQSDKLFARVYERFPILKDRASQSAGTLSGGEQQMLVIARALLAHPSILLLDEPSFGLSPQAIEEVFSILRELKGDGLTMLISEQNANQALAVADRIYVMDHGEIRSEGSREELQRSTSLESVYFGERPGSDAAASGGESQ